jgi:uncharacterized protein
LPTAATREFLDRAVDPPVRGFLHTPEAPNGGALVLTHGAGANAQAPLLVALAETFSAAGFTVLRYDLPYRQARSFGPPGPADAARDRAGLQNALAVLKRHVGAEAFLRPAREASVKEPSAVASPLSRSLPQDGNSQRNGGNIFLGGHSYGGRQSSMLCAELAEKGPNTGAANALVRPAGLLLLSYPLHPPRKSEQQRTQHLPSLRTPTLFVQGTRDPFGSVAEIEQALKMIPAKTKLLPVEGAGHDLGFKGKAKKEELPQLIFSEFAKFIGLSS